VLFPYECTVCTTNQYIVYLLVKINVYIIIPYICIMYTYQTSLFNKLTTQYKCLHVKIYFYIIIQYTYCITQFICLHIKIKLYILLCTY